MNKRLYKKTARINEFLENYMIQNGYTKTLAALERDTTFEKSVKKAVSLSFVIQKAPKRSSTSEVIEKTKKKTKKAKSEVEKSKNISEKHQK